MKNIMGQFFKTAREGKDVKEFQKWPKICKKSLLVFFVIKGPFIINVNL